MKCAQLIAVAGILFVSPAASNASPTFVCDTTNNPCWTLNLKLEGSTQAKPEVFFENSIDPLQSQQVGDVVAVRLPVYAPSDSGYYRITISVPLRGQNPLEVHLRAPAFMYTHPLEISIYEDAPNFGYGAIAALINGTTQQSGASYWKAYFQGQMYFNDARIEQNQLLMNKAQLAVFQGCAGLARDDHFKLLFGFDEEYSHCVGAGVSVSPKDLADASVSRWLLFGYATGNLPDGKVGTAERRSLQKLLVWLRGLWPTDQKIFAEYLDAYKDAPNNDPPFPKTLALFDSASNNVARPTRRAH